MNYVIQKLGAQGDGVTRSNQYIEGAIPGDEVTAKFHKTFDGVSRGEILQIIKPSTNRQAAPCVHYDKCGNCTVQHLTPSYYRRWKMETVRDAFERQGLRPIKWLPPVFLGSHNRRRATFTAVKSGGKVKFGYFRRRSQEIVEIDSCLVVHPKILEAKKQIQPLLVNILKEHEPLDIAFQLVNDKVDIVAKGLEKYRNKLTAEFGNLRVPLPPAAFLQPTLEGEKALVDAVMQALPKKGKFADLFSGCGTFTGAMLQRGPVDAFEAEADAFNALTKSIGTNPLRVFRRDLFRQPLRKDNLNRYDAIVFDPPRAGCVDQALRMAESKVGMLIGVSCNPATFARDARSLCDGGYWLQSLQVFDQFLWSHHVEVVGIFTKKKKRC